MGERESQTRKRVIVYCRENYFLAECAKMILKEDAAELIAYIGEVPAPDSYDYLISCEPLTDVLCNAAPMDKWVWLSDLVINLYGLGMDGFANVRRFQMDEPYNGIATGLSYMQFGIGSRFFPGKLGKLAGPSQDLYTDFEMVQWASKRNPDIQYCIVGLAPYSFRFDLSLSKENGFRALHYVPYIQKAHHHPLAAVSEAMYREQMPKFERLFCRDFMEKIFQHYLKVSKAVFTCERSERFDERKLTAEEHQRITGEIKKMFDKPYEKTLDENLEIFNNYLKFLTDRKIKTIVVLPPFPEIVRRNLPNELQQETVGIIREFQLYYPFDFVDCTYDEKFQDEDFYDWSHLNVTGMEKFSKIVAGSLG